MTPPTPAQVEALIARVDEQWHATSRDDLEALYEDIVDALKALRDENAALRKVAERAGKPCQHEWYQGTCAHCNRSAPTAQEWAAIDTALQRKDHKGDLL